MGQRKYSPLGVPKQLRRRSRHSLVLGPWISIFRLPLILMISFSVVHGISSALDNHSIVVSQTGKSNSRSRRFSAMRRHYLSSLLLPALLTLSGHAVLKAQQGSSSAVKGGRWSDTATWADKKVPGEGAIVTIDKGIDVVLDVSTPPLHGLNLNGKLSFADNKDLE